jgi:hypothetical protein
VVDHVVHPFALVPRMSRRWPEHLWIVRHGQGAGNVARDAANAAGHAVIDIAGRDVDVPLSALGEEQAGGLHPDACIEVDERRREKEFGVLSRKPRGRAVTPALLRRMPLPVLHGDDDKESRGGVIVGPGMATAPAVGALLAEVPALVGRGQGSHR